MRYAVYRCLYGEDYIQQSIKSIEPYVDKIFIFYSTRPWGDVSEVVYLNESIKFPKKFDNILEKIKELNSPKVIMVEANTYSPHNQLTLYINNHVLKNYDRPNTILVTEVDHVFSEHQIENMILNFEKSNVPTCSSRQVEHWKSPLFRIPERKQRTGAVLWNMKTVELLPRTGTQANIPNMPIIDYYVHNLGFAVSDKVMYWKHLTALAFSKKIGDSLPNEGWYENKWLSWDIKNNNTNLEISFGREADIPFAYPYNPSYLPRSLKEGL